MRSVLAVAAFLMALLVAAAPVEAACASGGTAAVEASVSQGATDVTAAANGGHCQHVPCSDSNHNHMPGGCAGHSFVPAFASEHQYVAAEDSRVAITHEDFSGRTLPPPVPPPLA